MIAELLCRARVHAVGNFDNQGPAPCSHYPTALEVANECCRLTIERFKSQDLTDQLVQKAAEQGQLMALKWLLALCYNSLDTDDSSPIVAAAKRGNLNMLQLMASHFSPAHWGWQVVVAAARHEACLAWLLRQDPGCPWIVFNVSVFHSLAVSGDLQALICLHEHSGLPTEYGSADIMLTAAEHGYLPMVQWLRSLHPTMPWPARLSCAAAEQGALHILQWISSQCPPCPLHCECLRLAALFGHLDTVQWLCTQPLPAPLNASCARAAAKSRDLRMLQCLRGRRPPCPWDECCTKEAACQGNLFMLQWLCEQSPPCPMYPDECLRKAAAYGHLPVMQYLHSLGHPLDSGLYYSAAFAAHQQHEVLQWLHRQGVPAPPKLHDLDTFARDLVLSISIPTLMLLGDIGVPIPQEVIKRLTVARKTFCTFHGLLRWTRQARQAVSGRCMGPDKPSCCPFSATATSPAGSSLLKALSMLPEELIATIAVKAQLQYK